MQATSSRRRFLQANRTSAVMGGISAVILIGVLALSLLAASPVTAQGGAVVRVDPASTTADINGIVVVNIRIENVANLAGAEVHLIYDPFLLEAQSIQAGGFPAPDYLLQSSATGGKIDYAIAQMPPHTPGNGGGVLLKINFKGLSAGTMPLHVLAAVLSDGGGALIPSTTQDGSVTVIPPLMRVEGRVLRQRVPPSTGPGTLKCTLVTATGASAYTDEAGYFELPVPSVGSYPRFFSTA